MASAVNMARLIVANKGALNKWGSLFKTTDKSAQYRHRGRRCGNENCQSEEKNLLHGLKFFL